MKKVKKIILCLILVCSFLIPSVSVGFSSSGDKEPEIHVIDIQK